MYKSLVDVSVLLIFFTRFEQFKQVFEQVKKARPSRLFLYQDGPRSEHPEDKENIEKCRQIAEDIDWECEVHKFYQEKNVGVDPSGYIADTWAFSQTDKCIVLEDDVVPTVSFFKFCKAMLDKYENNENVMLISGINIEEETIGVSSDYFFSSTTFTWGWASWSRVVNKWDPHYGFLRNKSSLKRMRKYINKKHLLKKMPKIFKEHVKSGKEHFETILISNQYLNEGLCIVPKKNMINNIGIAKDSAHYTGDIEMVPRGFRRVFTMDRYEIDTENIIHPETLNDYEKYLKNSYRIYAWGHPFVKIYRFLEVSLKKVFKGRGKEVIQDIAKRL